MDDSVFLYFTGQYECAYLIFPNSLEISIEMGNKLSRQCSDFDSFGALHDL